MKKDRKQLSRIQKLKRTVRWGRRGAGAFRIIRKYIYPWSLVAFAAFAYARYDIPVPHEKRK